MFLARKLDDPFGRDRQLLARGRYGVIEIRQGRLQAVHLRYWPKVVSALEVEWLGHRQHDETSGDRLLLYYNQPRRCPNYLALVYVVSRGETGLSSIQAGRDVLYEIARLKHSDAIVCDAWNLRISERLLARWGWEPHKPQRWHRNYIKRFYGKYPPPRIGDRARELSPSA
jgi:hypothetical protein